MTLITIVLALWAVTTLLATGLCAAARRGDAI
jgi:hypothetical protein